MMIIFSTAFTAQSLKVPKLKTVGAFKQPVIAQTQPEFVQKKGGFTILRRYYIARWGTQRYEYGVAQYQCRVSRCELLGEPAAIKFYRQCYGFKSNGQINCRNLESARVDLPDSNEREEALSRRRWYSCDDSPNPCANRDDLDEFPARYPPENPDLPSGI